MRITVQLCLSLLLAAGSITSLSGCSKRQAVVRISYACPGCSPEQADNLLVLPLHLFAQTGAEKVTGISTYAHADIYLLGQKGTDSAALLRAAENVAAHTTEWANGAIRLIEVKLLPASEAVPSEPAKNVDRAHVQIDSKKAAAAGLTLEEISRAIAGARGSGADSLEEVHRLGNTTMPVEGKHVVLGDVATITLEKGPDQIIRTLP